jgi:hypothetical protein
MSCKRASIFCGRKFSGKKLNNCHYPVVRRRPCP